MRPWLYRIASNLVIDRARRAKLLRFVPFAGTEQAAASDTVLAIPDPAPGGDSFYTVAELAPGWAAGGGSAHDQDSYRRALARVADSAYAPELLFAPTRLTSSGWWMIDAIHRAVAFLNTRTVAGLTTIQLRVFVLSRPIS